MDFVGRDVNPPFQGCARCHPAPRHLSNATTAFYQLINAQNLISVTIRVNQWLVWFLAPCIKLFLSVLICFAEFFQLHHTRFIANLPGDNLFRVLFVVRFNDCPAAVCAVVATPFEMMQIPRRVDFFDDRVTFASVVR